MGAGDTPICVCERSVSVGKPLPADARSEARLEEPSLAPQEGDRGAFRRASAQSHCRHPCLTPLTPRIPCSRFCSVFRGPEETRGAVANFLGIRHQKQKQKQANKKTELFRNCYPSSSCRGSVDAYLPPVASACPQVTFGKARETQLTSQRGQNLRNGVFL